MAFDSLTEAAGYELGVCVTVFLEAISISKTFITPSGDVTVLKNFHCRIQEGEFIFVTGPNGVGKSVFAKCLAGLIHFESGYITINGVKFESERFDRKTARAIGIEYLPQLLPKPANLTALEFLALGSIRNLSLIFLPTFWASVKAYLLKALRMAILDRSEFAKKVIHYLALAQPRDEFLFRPSLIRHAARQVVETHSVDFNLELLGVSLAQLSGPDLRRLYLVRALMSGARLLILDEPTAGLSEEEAQKLIYTLRDLAGRPRSMHNAKSGSEVTGSTGQANYAQGANEQLLSIIVIAHPIQLMSMPTKVWQLTSNGLEEAPSPSLTRQYSRAQRIPVHQRWAQTLPLGAVGSIELRRGKIVTIVGETSQEFFNCFEAARRTLRQEKHRVVREIPFDAIESGLAPSLPAYENCLVNRWRDDKRWIRYGYFIWPDRVREWLAKPIVETLRVTLKSVDSPVAHLSGGNKQLLLIGRELFPKPLDILIAGDLFRGLSDERMKDVIKLILSRATDGTCFVLFSVTPRFEELFSDETFRFESGQLHRIETL